MKIRTLVHKGFGPIVEDKVSKSRYIFDLWFSTFGRASFLMTQNCIFMHMSA